MMRTKWFGVALALLPLACGGQSGGCGGTYDYPRNDPGAALNDKALRLRVTQDGFDTVAGGLPPLIESTCSATDPNAACVLDSSFPERAWFYVGSPGAPMTFSGGEIRSGGLLPLDREFEGSCWLSPAIEDRDYCDDTGGAACQEILRRGVGTTGIGFCRTPGSAGCNSPGSDYCCGDAAPALCSGQYTITSCDAYRSRVALDLDTLRNHLALKLLDDNANGDGITVTLGCNAADPNDCDNDPASWVNGHLDLSVLLNVGGDGTCTVRDDAGRQKGFEIRTLRFTMRPHIVLGTDGKPYLRVADQDVNVDAFKFQLYTDVASDWSDPGCYDEGWSKISCNSDWNEDCTGSIANYCAAANFGATLASLFENLVGKLIANTVADLALQQFADKPLEATGELALAQLMPLPSRANPVGYLISANTDSPDVTGASGALGMNIDFNSGFVGPHHACVPVVTPPSWSLPALPDPGATVMAPDPLTGTLRPEPFHFAMLLGDAVIGRAAFELFDAGAFCLDLRAEAVGELSGGLFTPTVSALSIVAPGLVYLAPGDAPVDLALTPRFPPAFRFGTGAGSGDARDSHIQMTWPAVGIGMYPLVDDAFLRALAFEFDLSMGLSLEPTPQGNLTIMLDHLAFDNVAETYNEIGLPFVPQDFTDLVGLFLPSLLGNGGFDIQLTAASLGIPMVPKVRSVGAVDAAHRFLGVFLRLCTADQIADPNDALCYEPPALTTNSTDALAFAVERAAGPGGHLPANLMRVRPYSSVPNTHLELAYRVDGMGPYYSFRPLDTDGMFTVSHSLLALPGRHTLELVARDAAQPQHWSDPQLLEVLADHGRPGLSATRQGGQIMVQASDDQTPADRILVAASILDGAASRTLPYALRSRIAAAPHEQVTLWAEDEAGNESAPYVLAAVEVEGLPPEAEAESCAASGGAWSAVAGLLLLWRRRRR